MHVFLKEGRDSDLYGNYGVDSNRMHHLFPSFGTNRIYLKEMAQKVFIGLVELLCITAMVVETQFYIIAETSGTIYHKE